MSDAGGTRRARPSMRKARRAMISALGEGKAIAVIG
jgi:hypothetical protein